MSSILSVTAHFQLHQKKRRIFHIFWQQFSTKQNQKCEPNSRVSIYQLHEEEVELGVDIKASFGFKRNMVIGVVTTAQSAGLVFRRRLQAIATPFSPFIRLRPPRRPNTCLIPSRYHPLRCYWKNVLSFAAISS